MFENAATGTVEVVAGDVAIINGVTSSGTWRIGNAATDAPCTNPTERRHSVRVPAPGLTSCERARSPSTRSLPARSPGQDAFRWASGTGDRGRRPCRSLSGPSGSSSAPGGGRRPDAAGRENRQQRHAQRQLRHRDDGRVNWPDGTAETCGSRQPVRRQRHDRRPRGTHDRPRNGATSRRHRLAPRCRAAGPRISAVRSTSRGRRSSATRGTT